MKADRNLVAASLALLLLAGACNAPSSGEDATASQGPATTTASTSTSTTEPVLREGPPGDAFYLAPEGKPAARGDVIWASALPDSPPGTKGYRILYGSETVAGAPTAVSGLLYVPDRRPASEAPLPILALAHGTTGLADRCAPSRTALEGRRSEATFLAPEVLASHVVVATDYEGLGTPGVHPYLVGLSEGRSVLDSIRAAQRFPDGGASADSASVIVGHSQGGGAALVSAEIAPTYAPDTNVKGVAAGAPAAELKLIASSLGKSPFFGFLFMTAAGFQASYPDVDLSAIFTPAGIEGITAAGEQCGSETIAAFAGKDASTFVVAAPGKLEPFASILEENSPGARPSPVPVFLYHGEADNLVPAALSKIVLDRYCRNGTTVSRKTYPGKGHTDVVATARPDITSFLADRLAGKPAPSSC